MNKELVFNFTSHAAATKSLIYFPFFHILTWVVEQNKIDNENYSIWTLFENIPKTYFV